MSCDVGKLKREAVLMLDSLREDWSDLEKAKSAEDTLAIMEQIRWTHGELEGLLRQVEADYARKVLAARGGQLRSVQSGR